MCCRWDVFIVLVDGCMIPIKPPHYRFMASEGGRAENATDDLLTHIPHLPRKWKKMMMGAHVAGASK
jgi:hypothetical protein